MFILAARCREFGLVAVGDASHSLGVGKDGRRLACLQVAQTHRAIEAAGNRLAL